MLFFEELLYWERYQSFVIRKEATKADLGIECSMEHQVLVRVMKTGIRPLIFKYEDPFFVVL
jgi:hypothetical protein